MLSISKKPVSLVFSPSSIPVIVVDTDLEIKYFTDRKFTFPDSF